MSDFGSETSLLVLLDAMSDRYSSLSPAVISDGAMRARSLIGHYATALQATVDERNSLQAENADRVKAHNQIFDELRKAEDENAALREQLRWRDVGEELPEFGRPVIIYKAYHDHIDWAQLIGKDKNGYHWDCDYEHYITHWMPLPIPPQGNSDE